MQLIETLERQPNELKFGTSGLRGLVLDMTDLECYINTQGFMKFIEQAGYTKQPVYLSGDLRDSTPRILKAVNQALVDAGYETVYCGLIPTPAVAYYALQQLAVCIMVTGSHIPADRNGIKFYKPDGEVLKQDEPAIKQAVADIRAGYYGEDAEDSIFGAEGSLRQVAELPAETPEARQAYITRYTDVFVPEIFSGKKIVFYQHSSVGRDLLVEILERLGAEVVPVGRSDVFVPIDSENVTPNDAAYFKQLAGENPDNFAIVSTDGDSDRPFVIDATGNFHRGDVLGAVVAQWAKADFAGFPVSISDAATDFLTANNVEYVCTKIGSPYVVTAMHDAFTAGKRRVVGWEVNGGFMLGSDVSVGDGVLKALPTRDALLPIIVALLSAAERSKSVADIFEALPARATQAGLIDEFPAAALQAIISRFSEDTPDVRQELQQYFDAAHDFGEITGINTLDGVRITFSNGDIAHLRPSGNAPQLRIYSVANSQKRADEIVAMAIAEPDGIFRRLQHDLEVSDDDEL